MSTIAILKKIDIFKGLNDEELELISDITKARMFKKNTQIFSKGDENFAMYIVKEGNVDVFILTESGKELILATLGPGDYFGELSLLDEAPVSTNISTTSNCSLLTLHKTDFLQIIKRHPNILLNIVSHLCTKIRMLTDKVEGFALLDVYNRFSLLLNDLSVLTENGERVINKSLTHKNIALRIGSSREMVTRIIKDLESGGYISIDNKVITILKKLPSAW